MASHRLKSTLVAWGFLAPALVLFLYFKFIPMATALRMSLYEVRTYLGDEWVGLDNYRTIVSDERFTAAIWHSALLTVGVTAGSMLLGLVLALLVEGRAKYLWFVRTAAFLPVVTTLAVVAEVWRILYYPADNGPLNTVLGWVGLGPLPFLANEHSSLLSIMAVGVWKGAPYDMMIILAGLAGVDRTLYEASAVDGATTWGRFRHVTLPSLRGVFGILFILAAIRGLRVFTEVFLLTNGAPNGSTEVLMTLIYKLGLQQGELGVAAAGSVVLFLATVVLTLAVRLVRRRGAA
ncbi:carbohydrate ABC transporter permease [Hamadaea tsunoensis]|uniref:carbohydrate ABC transporter permease n=1 Tax=Hamadaea tsunoensis TaxID=53368 RepID=UPI0004154E71|nr:sugar ABC transporter permease [Hamadaea tsunoensis]